jgi:hypothetical protein
MNLAPSGWPADAPSASSNAKSRAIQKVAQQPPVALANPAHCTRNHESHRRTAGCRHSPAVLTHLTERPRRGMSAPARHVFVCRCC